jgi:hypothetical protein
VFNNLLLKHFSNGLVCRREEMVGQHHIIFCDKGIMVYGWIQIEENREVHGLLRVEELIFKAKALDFVKVN